MQKKWKIKQYDEDIVSKLEKDLNFEHIIALLLNVKGIHNKEESNNFICPTLANNFHDPFLFKDMKKAIQRVRKALDGKEYICIYGDRDVDGVSGSALLYKALKKYNAQVDVFVPGKEEGYGLNEKNVKSFYQNDCKLIITADNGITSLKAVDKANEYNIDVIIIDHHTPEDNLPNAYAIINPKCEEKYPFKDLAGVGVAYKFICSLFFSYTPDYNKEIAIMDHEAINLDLDVFNEYAVLGTLADVVTLTDENRLLVKLGLEKLKNTKIIGLDILLKKLGIVRKKLTSKITAWNVIPVLNAPGRMGKADKTLRLLITEDRDEAENIADEILLINEERKNRQGVILNKIIDVLEDKVDIEHDKIFIIDIEEQEHGVTGLIANKIKDMYYRPVVVIIIKDGYGIGSGRSIEKFMIYDAFKKCEDLFDEFGGHKYAVGFSIRPENIPEFKNRIKKIADESLKPEDLIPVLAIDAEIDSEVLDIELIKKIEQIFAPYGENNNEPLFLIKNLQLRNIIPIGQDKKHLKLIVETESIKTFEALWWSGTEKEFQFMLGKNYDMVFKTQINFWNNKESVNLIVEDMRLSEKEQN